MGSLHFIPIMFWKERQRKMAWFNRISLENRLFHSHTISPNKMQQKKFISKMKRTKKINSYYCTCWRATNYNNDNNNNNNNEKKERFNSNESKKKNRTKINKQKTVKRELVLNEPLALGSNESGYYVAVFTCWWFSVLFDIIFTLLANCWGAAFAVCSLWVFFQIFEAIQIMSIVYFVCKVKNLKMVVVFFVR